MNISPADLDTQVVHFLSEYPWVWSLESSKGLPRGLLLAVGSRETNLVNELGDGGHGHGVWQLDDRSHVIPDPFPVETQADVAAGMLASYLQAQGGNVDRAACIYNSGQPVDEFTTGGDYGSDVYQRMQAIQKMFPVVNPPIIPAHPNGAAHMLYLIICNATAGNIVKGRQWVYNASEGRFIGLVTEADAKAVAAACPVLSLSGAQIAQFPNHP